MHDTECVSNCRLKCIAEWYSAHRNIIPVYKARQSEMHPQCTAHGFSIFSNKTSIFVQKSRVMVAQALEASARKPLKLAQTSRWVSLEAYIRREAKHVHKHEYLDGKIVRMPYAKGPHNEISANIVAALKSALKILPKKYRVFSSDQKIYFPELNHGSYADALAVSEKPEYWDDNQLLLINPLLIVEVLSDSTEAYDRQGKFAKYKTLPSFQEYVLVKQNKCHVETWFRQEPGLWRETIVTDPAGKIELKSLGCSISLADVYEHIEF